MQTHIQAPNPTSLVSHDEFKEDLVGMVFIGPRAFGITRGPPAETAGGATPAIKARRDDEGDAETRTESGRRKTRRSDDRWS